MFIRAYGVIRIAVLVVAAASLAARASADAAGVRLLGNISQLQFDRNNNFGWRFMPTAAITVSALGYFDVSSLPGGGGAGLVQAHDVGIFRVADQSLVTQVTVQAGTAGSLAENYRYTPLASPVSLAAGETYLLAAYVLSGSPDALPGASNWAMGPAIEYANSPPPTPGNPLGGTSLYITNAHGNPPNGLDYAGLAVTGLLPVFGANFRFMAPQHPGDLNCDGALNFNDINPFVLALSDPAGYGQRYPDCNILNGDINGDGRVDFADINPFVALLASED